MQYLDIANGAVHFNRNLLPGVIAQIPKLQQKLKVCVINCFYRMCNPYFDIDKPVRILRNLIF